MRRRSPPEGSVPFVYQRRRRTTGIRLSRRLSQARRKKSGRGEALNPMERPRLNMRKGANDAESREDQGRVKTEDGQSQFPKLRALSQSRASSFVNLPLRSARASPGRAPSPGGGGTRAHGRPDRSPAHHHPAARSVAARSAAIGLRPGPSSLAVAEPAALRTRGGVTERSGVGEFTGVGVRTLS